MVVIVIMGRHSGVILPERDDTPPKKAQKKART
jgi:hypothetical protein